MMEMPLSVLATDIVLPAPVLLVEDDMAVRRRLEGLLIQFGYKLDAIIFAASLAEARACLAEQPVALALVDIGLPDGSGIDLIVELHASDPGLAILVISAWCTQDVILSALRAGAVGYVLKERDDLEVAIAIRSVLRGGAPIDPFVAKRIIEELPSEVPERSDDNGMKALTARETQILLLVAEGLGNRDIAERLCLSRYTVECHIKRVYRKLAVSSRTRAIHTARQRGLLA
ncbi:response regulator transcription factor [Brucella pseudogrignonensis]|jgi:DNA-binding NarL/FixJ family response regulator|uniref:response regulator transcription factor n=1 Tax=Brucella pseudogrignonensis TaxID=419475 RepID=UPI00190D1116|nr:response regulator transcription factor [Brucella pseudogrignonensis]UKK95368.1 response regulator transcription factor [Brucella pseudogrignonensis]